MFPVAAIAVTLAAAVLFGLSTVLEQRSTKQVPVRGVLAPRLLLDLARRPMWLVAISLQITGNALQVVALHIGPLALVQPILVCDLLFAVLFAAAARHRPPDRVILGGVICCAAGVACFLAVARPSGGHRTVSAGTVLPVAVILAAIMAVCLAGARWGPRQVRPIWLALACGVDFGVTAFLLKLVPDTLSAGFSDPVRQWPLYALVIVGPAGFLLNQEALQAGTLISPVLAVITTADPLVSIGLAHVWLDENIASAPLDLVAEGISLAVMTAGIAALAHRAPHVTMPGGPGEHGRELPTERISAMAEDGAGIVTKLSPYSVEDTVTRLADLGLVRGMKLFAVIDHTDEARAAGLLLRDTRLVIFGDPVAAARVITASPLAGLDLPIRALVWDDGGKTRISYYEPTALVARHQVSANLAAALSGVNALTDAVISPQPTR